MTKPLCTVVGMGPGMGLAIARRFAKEGFRIAMLARKKEALEECRQELEGSGYEAHYFIADVADFNNIKEIFSTVREQLGDTEVLVYNPSVYREASATELDPEILIRDLRVDVAGALVAVQGVIRGMREKGKGTILLTGGGQALDPNYKLVSLGIGKAGLRNLAFNLYRQLKPEGIHAGTVTVNGMIKKGTKFDPDKISEAFWELHQQPANSFQAEIIYE